MAYRIATDSCCDVPAEKLAEWGVRVIQLEVLVDGEDSRPNDQVDVKTFYDSLRAGKMARTTAANIAQFKDFFKPVLDAGEDVLYLAFSSGLSTTYQSAVIAAEELREEYPERKILVYDTLCASLGQGLFVCLAAEKQRAGADIDEVYAYLDGLRLHLVHWFTVDDLMFLKRGGRVSGAAALVGTMLGIKPILHVDDEGRLLSMSKVRGRKAAIEALANQYGMTVSDCTAPVFISHGDCAEDAHTLAEILRERYGVMVMLTDYIGPVIGAHSGPGTLALFYVGEKR